MPRTACLIISAFLIVLFPLSAQAAVQMTIPSSATEGSEISLKISADADALVPVKAVDSGGNIVFYEEVRMNSQGRYWGSLSLPDSGAEALLIIAGQGIDVDSEQLLIIEKRNSSAAKTNKSNFVTTATGKLIDSRTVELRAKEPAFWDLKGHWAQNSLQKIIERGLLSGYPDNSFRPDNNMSRAEFVTLMVKAMGLHAEGTRSFEDTKSHWAHDYISIALLCGLVNGYSDREFGPDNPISREQMALIISKAAGLGPGVGQCSFGDLSKASPWALDAIARVVSSGIMKGYPDGNFAPCAYTTRAEAAMAIAKTLD